VKRSFVVIVLVGFVSVWAGCKGGKHPAEQADPAKAPEAPPSVERLKEMISRAASISVETFDKIAKAGAFDRRRVLRGLPGEPLTVMMLTSTFKEQERDLKVELPEASQPRPLSAAPRLLVINIRRDGDIIIAGKLFEDDQALRKLLKRVAEEDPNRRVLIRCDKDALHKHVARVVSLCREAGISEANIGFTFPRQDVPAKAPAPPKPAPATPAPPTDPAAKDAKAPEKPGDFRLLPPGGLGRADMLARALRGRGKPQAKAAGQYVSVIWPEYITECTRSVKGDTITGKVSFRAGGVYEGTVEYTAGRGPKGWRIEEFRLPISARRTVLTVRGTWIATPDKP